MRFALRPILLSFFHKETYKSAFASIAVHGAAHFASSLHIWTRLNSRCKPCFIACSDSSVTLKFSHKKLITTAYKSCVSGNNHVPNPVPMHELQHACAFSRVWCVKMFPRVQKAERRRQYRMYGTILFNLHLYTFSCPRRRMSSSTRLNNPNFKISAIYSVSIQNRVTAWNHSKLVSHKHERAT